MSTTNANIVQFQHADLVAVACDVPSKNMTLLERDVKQTTFLNPVDIYTTISTTFTRFGVNKDALTIQYQAMLHRILSANATYNPSVGYCQGMTAFNYYPAHHLMKCKSLNSLATSWIRENWLLSLQKVLLEHFFDWTNYNAVYKSTCRI